MFLKSKQESISTDTKGTSDRNALVKILETSAVKELQYMQKINKPQSVKVPVEQWKDKRFKSTGKVCFLM